MRDLENRNSQQSMKYPSNEYNLSKNLLNRLLQVHTMLQLNIIEHKNVEGSGFRFNGRTFQ